MTGESCSLTQFGVAIIRAANVFQHLELAVVQAGNSHTTARGGSSESSQRSRSGEPEGRVGKTCLTARLCLRDEMGLIAAPERRARLSRSTKPARRGPPGAGRSVRAQKEVPPATPEKRVKPRSVRPARPPAEPLPEEEERRVATTIAFPTSVMRRIQERLRKDQEHNLRSLVLYALNEIGVYVEPEHMKPMRRRWTR